MEVTLEESTTDKVAPLLHQIVDMILRETQTFDSLQKDFFFILVLISMIENGFVLVDKDLVVINPTESLEGISQWKSATGTYQASMLMKKFENITVKVIMSPLGSTALVNVVLDEVDESYSACLPMSRYVVSPQATSIPMIFRDLKHFSTSFKNKVISAVKSTIFAFYGYASASLGGLPEEVLIKIILNLPVCDILNVSRSSRGLRNLLNNEGLWYILYRRDYQNCSQTDCTNWKEMYKNKYLVELDKRLRSERRARNYMNYSYLMSDLGNSLLNTI